MFTLDGMRKFHGWTHASLGLLLDHLSSMPSSEYSKVLADAGFPTVREQVIHIFNCEAFWVHTLQRLEHVDRTSAEFPAAADARILEQEVIQGTHKYLSGLTDQHLNSHAELKFPDGSIVLRTPAFVLHHVLTHAFHHKGQIVAMCRALGYPAPVTDLSELNEITYR